MQTSGKQSICYLVPANNMDYNGQNGKFFLFKTTVVGKRHIWEHGIRKVSIKDIHMWQCFRTSMMKIKNNTHQKKLHSLEDWAVMHSYILQKKENKHFFIPAAAMCSLVLIG